jgi:hypothetical protein
MMRQHVLDVAMLPVKADIGDHAVLIPADVEFEFRLNDSQFSDTEERG